MTSAPRPMFGRLLPAFLAAACLGLAPHPSAAQDPISTTFIVQNLNDAGPGSLRQALAAANDGDAVVFEAALRGTLTLTSGVLRVTRGVNIQGPGAGVITIDGNGEFGVFDLTRDIPTGYSDVTISGLTIQKGTRRARAAPSSTTSRASRSPTSSS